MIELLPYQKEAVKKLKPGKILRADVGTGKSLTSLAFYIRCCKVFKKDFPLYIITTAKKRDSLEWNNECNKICLENEHITIDSWNNIQKYEKIKNAFFIFDEQKAIGSGTWSKLFIKIAKNNLWIMLTATPGDIWEDYIPVFIANGFYKNRTEFYRKHVIFDRFVTFPKIATYVNIKELIQHRDDILVEMKKTTKPKTRITKQIIVDYDRNLYNDIFRKRWNPFTNEPIKGPSEYCSCLRKVCNTSEYKLDMLTNLFDNNKNKKLIIFYNFDYELEMLRKWCEDIGVTYSEWNGHKHQLIPKTDEWVYLTQYTSGCEGWNCIETNTIIFFSLSYSYKQMTQAAGRIDRLNNPADKLYYFYLTTSSSIDFCVQHSLEEKRDFNEKKFFEGDLKLTSDETCATLGYF